MFDVHHYVPCLIFVLSGAMAALLYHIKTGRALASLGAYILLFAWVVQSSFANAQLGFMHKAFIRV